MRKAIEIIIAIVFLLLAIAFFFERESDLYACSSFTLFIILTLPYVFPEQGVSSKSGKNKANVSKSINWDKTVSTWSFSLRVKILKAIINSCSVYIATSDGVEEHIEADQVNDNEQSGMITIQLEQI